MSPTIYHIAISCLTYVENWVPTSPMDFSVGQMKSLDQSGLPRQAQPVKQSHSGRKRPAMDTVEAGPPFSSMLCL